jgi:hypothetical protein
MPQDVTLVGVKELSTKELIIINFAFSKTMPILWPHSGTYICNN